MSHTVCNFGEVYRFWYILSRNGVFEIINSSHFRDEFSILQQQQKQQYPVPSIQFSNAFKQKVLKFCEDDLENNFKCLNAFADPLVVLLNSLKDVF